MLLNTWSIRCKLVQVPGRKAPEADRREQILTAAFHVATQRRLQGLTIRAIATEAGLSPGLVLFHFSNSEGLRLALLDWLLANTLIGEPFTFGAQRVASKPGAPTDALGSARERLLGAVEQELALLPERKPRLELFFDYWVLGFGEPQVRRRIRRALKRYRAALVELADQVVAESPARFQGVTGNDLASLVVALIEGCVMQAIVDPRGLDLRRACATLRAVVAPGE
jgi:TetR/AcrR family transcriptional repressor of bet genes